MFRFIVMAALLAASFNVSAMEIFVKISTTNTLTLDVEASDSVLIVKNKIKDRESIPVDRQQLTFSGTELENDKTLAYYNIQKESTLQLALLEAMPVPALSQNLILALAALVALMAYFQRRLRVQVGGDS